MKVDLDRKDLIALVKGTSPNYSEFNNPLVKANGSYCGGFVERWDWSLTSDITDSQLYELYKICKASWV